MNKPLTVLSTLAAALLLSMGAAQASTHKGAPDMKAEAKPASTADCEKQAADKKLAGAAKNSFVKKCSGGGAAAPAKSAAGETCDKAAAEKKLAGAAKNSFVKKCVKDAEGAPAAKS